MDGMEMFEDELLCETSGLPKSECYCCVAENLLEINKTTEELTDFRNKWRKATLKKQYGMTVGEANAKWSDARQKVKEMRL